MTITSESLAACDVLIYWMQQEANLAPEPAKKVFTIVYEVRARIVDGFARDPWTSLRAKNIADVEAVLSTNGKAAAAIRRLDKLFGVGAMFALDDR